jgi:hypothetical protein
LGLLRICGCAQAVGKTGVLGPVHLNPIRSKEAAPGPTDRWFQISACRAIFQGMPRSRLTMYDLLAWLFGTNEHGIDRTALWTGVIALVTFGGVLFAWVQLRAIRKTSRADFAKRFIDTFFNDDTRTLFALVMNSALVFEVKNICDNGQKIDRLPYMKIRPEIVAQLAGIVAVETGRRGYSPFEIDDFLLGHFDDLGRYVKQKLIDFKTARHIFSYYVTESFENPAIIEYLNLIPAVGAK